MAKVAVVYEQKKQCVWEPYATLTVSKRELAGLHKLLGAAHYRLVGGELFSQINDVLEKYTGGFVGNNNLKVSVSDLDITILDAKYGEV